MENLEEIGRDRFRFRSRFGRNFETGRKFNIFSEIFKNIVKDKLAR